MPDADDTAGALLALANLRQRGLHREDPGVGCTNFSFGRNEAPTESPTSPRPKLKFVHPTPSCATDSGEGHAPGFPGADETASVLAGVRWLVDLQNRDGGWPTFCRGWGKLPFDRSGADLTAHVLRAFLASRPVSEQSRDAVHCGSMPLPPVTRAITRGIQYLQTCQRSDGSWVPLWFGNQHVPNDENPTFGTARVLLAYRDLDLLNSSQARRGLAWLGGAQNPDGGWGGAAGTPSTVEETALAVEALANPTDDASALEAQRRGVGWLLQRIENGEWKKPSPIGLYFAKLWYFEKLYPQIFTVAALGRARRVLAPQWFPTSAHAH